MKTIRFTFLMAAFLISITSLAQQEWDMTPQPPDAATFSTFGTFPVSYYTGTPDISIPLFTLDEGEIDVPITLSYNARGVRVADESTWVGLGWNLYPGGSISRVVMGSQYDNHDSDMYNVFLNHWQQDIEIEYLQRQHPLGYWGTFTEGGIQSIDIEIGNDRPLTDFSTVSSFQFQAYSQSGHMFQPDIYTFSFLGYAGKFYINPENNQIVILDKKEHLIIEKDATNWNPEVNGWTILLPNGVKVYFQDIERVYQPVVAPDCSSSAPSLTWKITKIELKNGKEILFSYNNTIYETATISDYDTHTFEDDADYQLNRNNSGYGNFNVPHYTPIYCSTVGKPVAVKNELKTLSQITSPKYTINFNTLNGVAKPRLTSLEILDNCDPSFSIGYNFSMSPFNCIDGSWNKWTLSNGVAQNYGTETNFVKYKLNQVQKYSIQNGSSTVFDNPYIFDYQENIGLTSIFSFAQDYWGYYNGEHNNTGLIPDESQMYATGGPYPEVHLPDRFPFDDLRVRANSNRGVSPSHLIQGSLRKITYPTTGYTIFNFEPHQFFLSDMHDYILLASEINYDGLHYVNNYNGSSSALSIGAGLRIKELVNYDTDGQFLGRKKFNYDQSGILLEPVHFWSIEPKVQIIENGDFDNILMSEEFFYYKTWSANSSNHNQSFAIPNSVGYSYVEVIDSDSEVDNPNEKLNGKTIYRFYNNETVYNLQFSRVSPGYIDSRNGLPTSIELKDSTGTSIKKTTYNYTKVDNSLFLSFVIKHICSSVRDEHNFFKIEYTPMIAEWWKNEWTDETQDGLTIRTASLYSSDAHSNARLTKQITKGSKGEDIEMSYYYAQDNPSNILTGPSTIASMISANMVEVPLKTEKRVGGILLEGTIFNYDTNLYPASTYKLNGSSYELEQNFLYQQGKIVQYTGKDKVPISFLWGCNYTKPVAKAFGVDYSTLNSAYTAVGGNLNALNGYSSLSNALITTYTHNPFMGLSSQLDPNGILTTYNYDEFGRLKLIKDADSNILQNYQYHYKGQ